MGAATSAGGRGSLLDRRLPLVLAVALLVGACSSGDPADQDAAAATTGTERSTTTTPATTATTGPEPGAALRLDLRGLGPVRVGMTVEEAGAALGRPLEPTVPPPDPDCAVYGPASGLDGISFMVVRGVVARADVAGGPTATAEGLAVGQTEDEAQRRYGGRLEMSAHDYLIGGHYLTLVPSSPDDAGFRLVAETDGTRVTALKAGRLPEVLDTDGCS